MAALKFVDVGLDEDCAQTNFDAEKVFGDGAVGKPALGGPVAVDSTACLFIFKTNDSSDKNCFFSRHPLSQFVPTNVRSEPGWD